MLHCATKKLATCSNRPRRGRPRTARTHFKIKVIRERIRRNPKRSMRKMARSLEIDEKSVRTIVKEDLKLSQADKQTITNGIAEAKEVGSHTLVINFQASSHFTHASLGVPLYSLPTDFNFGLCVSSLGASTSESITTCLKFFVVHYSIPNCRFCCF